MFPKLQRKLVIIYTLSTGLIITLILAAMLLFYVSSQENRQKADFQNHLFTLMSKLQADEHFSDSFLAQLELKNHLIIYIEENRIPFFFSGSYQPPADREALRNLAEEKAKKEGIYPNSHPVSSNLLQSSVFSLKGQENDSYLGNILILQTSSGYKKLILIQDISENRQRLLKIAGLYFLADCIGILLLFLTGHWFVRRSLKPLEETYTKQQDFVSAASHELRSPLSVIRTTADAVAPASPGDARLLEIIKRECKRGSSLINNLLLLASADQKKWAVKKKEFEIDELLLELLELYEPLCVSKEGKLLLILPAETLPKVYADPDLCRQIFTILLDNAVSYALTHAPEAPGAPGGAGHSRKIILRAEASSSHGRPHVTVSVADHGPGISDEEKKLIFDSFYRSDQSRNKKEHFGLGLSIAAALAKIQGISLHVRDTDGGGTTFCVKI